MMNDVSSIPSDLLTRILVYARRYGAISRSVGIQARPQRTENFSPDESRGILGVPHRKHTPSPESKLIPVTGLGGL
jgi:hypothetical protein